MGGFTNGFLVGLGLALILAPQKGSETRQLLNQRMQYLRGIPPENEELKQSVAQMTQQVQEVQSRAEQAAQMGSAAQNSATATANSANTVRDNLNRVARQAGTTDTSPNQTRA